MFQGLKNVDLTKHIFHSVLLDDLNLVHVLHGIHLFSVLFLNNTHLLERELERKGEG